MAREGESVTEEERGETDGRRKRKKMETVSVCDGKREVKERTRQGARDERREDGEAGECVRWRERLGVRGEQVLDR